MVLTASTCKKKEDCHSIVKFMNQSEKDVFFALRFSDYIGNCRLDGNKVMKNGTFDFKPYKSCIEDNLNSNRPLDIYIVDSNKYNELDVFYNCDSIGIKNELVKQFSLTLDDLRQSNFTITYP